MKKGKVTQKKIYVYADWEKLKGPKLLGILWATPSRGKEIFSFEYESQWLKSEQGVALDPNLRFFHGPQYPKSEHQNFGLFLDSSPDRWGRVLLRRREEQLAREEKRPSRTLMESDYLLGVFDGHRMGALRFKTDPLGAFLDNDHQTAAPPWTQLKKLEHASFQLEKNEVEKDKNYIKWLKLLIAPGGSLGGARPKASVIDENKNLWIAKFPSRHDDLNMGAWEFLVHELAGKAKIMTAKAQIKRFTGKYDTFLTKRFDRNYAQRIHFASAMTLLDRKDGEGASYLDIVDFLIKNGAQVNEDLKELWRRIVFNICVSNVDDHLRNHGFILTDKGWKLSPAYDMNPCETGNGLKLNISKDDNSQDLDLALDVVEYFRINKFEANKILTEIRKTVLQWKDLAKRLSLTKEIFRMQHAFRIVEN